ncbi:MAG: hypothetical protein V3T17_09120 [Pseudomonadales bacterium]
MLANFRVFSLVSLLLYGVTAAPDSQSSKLFKFDPRYYDEVFVLSIRPSNPFGEQSSVSINIELEYPDQFSTSEIQYVFYFQGDDQLENNHDTWNYLTVIDQHNLLIFVDTWDGEKHAVLMFCWREAKAQQIKINIQTQTSEGAQHNSIYPSKGPYALNCA